MLDMIVRGGRVIDGSGGPAFTADVGIVDGRVVTVGRLSEPARETLDADGLIVAPGWVDVHTHYDGQATWDTLLSPSSQHGVTTVVFGNCGVGFAPVREGQREWLVALMEGVEDIPGSALASGILWDWETFPEYLDALDRRAYAVDVGAHLAHGPLRAYVMQERGARNEAATADDLEEMVRIVRLAQSAGAFGLSTSRTRGHRSKDGAPVPGTFAAADELIALARAVADSGHGHLQWAPAGLALADGPNNGEELPLMAEVSARSRCAVSFLCLQTTGDPFAWREQLTWCSRAEALGGRISAQVSPRSTGLIAGFRTPHHPFAQSAIWRALSSTPFEERIAALRASSALRRRLVLEGVETLAPTSTGRELWDLTFAFAGVPNYEPDPDTSIGACARRAGVDPRELALDAMLDGDGDGLLITHLMNYAGGDLSPSYEMLQSAYAVSGGSDAGAHVGSVCDAGMPTFLLTHWFRDRSRGPRLPLEHLIKKQTSDTARRFGLNDRGRIQTGMIADLNVIDMDNLKLGDLAVLNDLPGGALRLGQTSEGYVATLKRGRPTFLDAKATGARPGRLVRSGRPVRADL